MSSNYLFTTPGLESFTPIKYPRFENHFTASAVVIALGHILLVHHKRIAAWLPPGGHIDPQEMPHEAAVREVLEETSVEVEILSEPLPQTGSLENLFLPQPLCMHAVKAVENQQTLYHVDLVYLCRPVGATDKLPVVATTDEVHDARWFSLSKMDEVHLAKNVVEVIEVAARKLQLAG